ncbi:MAG: DUF4864 domain-containing protein [Chloroflexi bacterium]|nr:DUF4864 domain-containing protein [Chloroflexota bacterium]
MRWIFSSELRPIALALGLFGVLLSGAARAASGNLEPSKGSISTSDRAAIRTVIEQQLDAFQRDDAKAAFALAAPGIHYTFRTPERFMIVVKRGYKPVYRPRVVEFRDIQEVDGIGPVQSVYFEGMDGDSVIALYPMQRQPDGSWRINGAHLVRSDERPI